MSGRIATSICAFVAVSSLTLVARAADDEARPQDGETTSHRSSATETPIVGYAYSTGVSAGTVGAMGFGSGLVYGTTSTLGGGGTVWGSPIDRLTIVADAQRD